MVPGTWSSHKYLWSNGLPYLCCKDTCRLDLYITCTVTRVTSSHNWLYESDLSSAAGSARDCKVPERFYGVTERGTPVAFLGAVAACEAA